MANAEDKLKLKLPKTEMLENLGQNWVRWNLMRKGKLLHRQV